MARRPRGRKRFVVATGLRYRRKLKSPSKMRWVPIQTRWEEQDAIDSARARARSKAAT